MKFHELSSYQRLQLQIALDARLEECFPSGAIGERWPEQIMVLWGWNRFYGIGPVLPNLAMAAVLKRQYSENPHAMKDLNNWYP